MTVKGENFAAVVKSMADNNNALVPVPAFRLGVGHQAMTNAVDRFAKALTAANAPPIFSGMEFTIAGTKTAEITAAGSVGPVWWVKGEIEYIDYAAGCIAGNDGRPNSRIP